MRKIIIISIIFSVLLGVAIWEIVFSTRLYNTLHSGLERLDTSIEASEDISGAETLEIMDGIMAKWNKGKQVLFCFGNHTVLRNVDEKLVSLNAMVRTDYRDDARITVAVARSVIKALLNDAHPVPTNLF